MRHSAEASVRHSRWGERGLPLPSRSSVRSNHHHSPQNMQSLVRVRVSVRVRIRVRARVRGRGKVKVRGLHEGRQLIDSIVANLACMRQGEG